MPCLDGGRTPISEVEMKMHKLRLLMEEYRTGIHVDSELYCADGHAVIEGHTQRDLDHSTRLLCSRMREEQNISKYSLEMQIWWRDHQIADKKREEEMLEDVKRRSIKETALSKLTREEREILGL